MKKYSNAYPNSLTRRMMLGAIAALFALSLIHI